MKWILNTYRTCDEWGLDRIIDVCQKTGYAGIEFLMGTKQKQPHGIEVEASDPYIQSAMVYGAGLMIGSLTSGARFDSTDPAERQKNVDYGRRLIDLAERMNARRSGWWETEFRKETRSARNVLTTPQRLLGNSATTLKHVA